MIGADAALGWVKDDMAVASLEVSNECDIAASPLISDQMTMGVT
jgi:hypothetical protein